MKLASLNRGRDGQLIVVNRALTHATLVSDIAPTLQYALDNWQALSPQLGKVYDQLNANELESQFPFEIKECASPLPRAFQWADGSAYVNHVELVRKARGAEMPASFWTDPLVYQGMSDGFYSPTADIEIADINWGVDFEGEIAVITDDVPMAVNAKDAAEHIKLLMLVNDVSLRNLIPGELGKGFGFFQSKPASAFSAVAITPDELNDSWQDNKVHLPLNVWLNEQQFGQPNAGIDMTFDFSQLVEHVAKSRHLAAGTIIGSGTVSNRDRSAGSCCIAEVRMIETIEDGAPKTPFMQYGDRVKIDMVDSSGKSIFGAIEQQVVPYQVQIQ
jgi:fumarylacetoacetate (FAA) hydrolase